MHDMTPEPAQFLTQFPQSNFETVCFHSLGLIESNREYLEQHLEKLGGDEASTQALADIQTSCARLDRTLNEMMALLGCMRGTARPTAGPFDLRGLLRTLAPHKEPILNQLEITLTLHCEEEEPLIVCADEDWAEQICRQLLSNALHACDRGGHIEFSLRRENGVAFLSVEDDGCGLPDASPRARLENRRRFLGGAQAGLLLCREYCAQMGWTLDLTARPAKGTRALLTIPMDAVCTDVSLREANEQEQSLNDLQRKRFMETEIAILEDRKD